MTIENQIMESIFEDIQINLINKDQLQALSFNIPEEFDEDLMYTHFILNHEGSNGNHDIFERDIMKLRAETAINKPIDIEHKQPIIGTIIDSRYVEPENGKAYVECVGVIWKYLYKQVANTIKEYFAAGKVKVSQESWFKDAIFIVGDKEYDSKTAYAMGICDDKKKLRALNYNGQPCYRKFVDIIYGGVGVTTNPADNEAIFLAVANDIELANIEENIDNKNNNEVVDNKIAYSEGFHEVYGDRFGIYNSLPILDYRSDKSISLKNLVLQAISILEDKIENEFCVSEINNDFILIKQDNNLLKAEYEVDDESIIISNIREISIEYIENKPDAIEKIQGSEDIHMDLEQIKVALPAVVDKIEDEDIKNELNQIISALSEIKVEEQETDDQALSELRQQITDQEKEVERLNAELINVDTLKERAEKAEADLQDLKDKVAKEEEDRAKQALAENRIKELEDAGIVYDEKMKEKAFAKFKIIDDQQFADLKEELLYVKTLAEKQTEIDDSLEIDPEDKSKSGLNLELSLNLPKDPVSLWEKPSK